MAAHALQIAKWPQARTVDSTEGECVGARMDVTGALRVAMARLACRASTCIAYVSHSRCAVSTFSSSMRRSRRQSE